MSVCIATFKRTDRLDVLLSDLALQQRLPEQVVVVDNDRTGSARSVIEQHRRAGAPFRLDYDVQPVPNIALTRNRTVELATGDWLAFIDDDERAPKEWLQQLVSAAQQYAADGILAPVEPELPPEAPEWIRRGRFYDFAHLTSGAVVPLNRMRFGNVILRGEPLRAEQGPFDARFGLSTGEDGDLLVRLANRGAKIVWYDEAAVFEPIEMKRLSLRWLMLRAMSGGQAFARATVNGDYRPIGWAGRCIFFVRALMQLIAALIFSLVTLPLGRHHAAAWLVTAWANVGKLSVMWGSRYRAYAHEAEPKSGPASV